MYSQLQSVLDAHELQVFELYEIEPWYRTASALSPGSRGEDSDLVSTDQLERLDDGEGDRSVKP